jgi:hypothetical protein
LSTEYCVFRCAICGDAVNDSEMGSPGDMYTGPAFGGTLLVTVTRLSPEVSLLTKRNLKMKKQLAFVIALLTGIQCYAQNPVTPEPSVPQPVPQQNPVPTTTEPERKPDFNSPQSPQRQPHIPSEDTLIKGQKSSGAVIRDTLMPSTNRKNDRINRRKGRKGTAEMDDTTSNGNTDPAKKP